MKYLQTTNLNNIGICGINWHGFSASKSEIDAFFCIKYLNKLL